MSPMGMLPYMNYQQHHEELLKLAADSRMLEQAFKADKPHKNTTSKFLGFLGKELASLGFSLELRFGGQSESQAIMNQQRNRIGCS